jgi:hypothetical protein
MGRRGPPCCTSAVLWDLVGVIVPPAVPPVAGEARGEGLAGLLRLTGVTEPVGVPYAEPGAEA